MIEHIGNNLILKYAKPNGSILELGNQIMNLENVQDISGKKYYSKLGYKHTSLDQNGKDGALKVDLSKPIKLKGYHDLITDIGTSEHVEDLFQCLLNVTNHANTGSVMIHKNPKTGNFPFHGHHFFTLEFWEEWAEVCGLEIIELFEHPIYHNEIDGWECIAVLKHTDDSATPTIEDWDKIKHLIKQS